MNRLKTCILGLVLMFLPLSGAWGQSVISDVQYTYQDTTIVRYWKDGISIMYTQTGNDNNCFLLVDTATPQVLRMTLTDNVKVNDFRIHHDRVYMCGHYVESSGTQKGWLAFFDIQAFYNGTGTCHWMKTQPTAMPDFYGGSIYNQIYDITRLAVYDDVQSGTQIAYVGKNYILGETLRRVGIGWATCYMGMWQSTIMYNKGMDEEYTDIIATQNYVVAVGRDAHFTQLVLRIFPKGNFLIPTWTPIPNSWPYYYNMYGQRYTDLNIDGNVMATALDNDKFAVAFHYMGASNEGLAVKTFSITGATASLLQGLNAQVARQSGSSWVMRDIGYSPTIKSLMVLNDFDGGTTGSQESIVYQFPLPSLSAGTYYGCYLPGYGLHALTPFGTIQDAFVATGGVLGGWTPSLWEKLTASTSCGLHDAIYGEPSTATYDTPPISTNMNIPTPYPDSTTFVVEMVERDVLCIKP